MANGDDSLIHWIQSGAIAALSILGGVLKWNWDKLNKDLEGKADKGELDQLRTDLAARWVRQDTMHSENQRRLDNIYNLLVNHSLRNPGSDP